MVKRHILPDLPGKIAVTFSVPASIWADRVHLVGDFNRWDATATPLKCSEDGWSATLVLDRDRTFGYCYLLDGQTWMCDCNADASIRSDSGRAISVLVGEGQSAWARVVG